MSNGNGVLSFNEEVCICGEHVKGRLAGAKTRGSKQMRMFECAIWRDRRGQEHGCSHRWSREVVTVSVPIAPRNGHPNGNGNGHGPEVAHCPNCNHEFEVTHG